MGYYIEDRKMNDKIILFDNEKLALEVYDELNQNKACHNVVLGIYEPIKNAKGYYITKAYKGGNLCNIVAIIHRNNEIKNSPYENKGYDFYLQFCHIAKFNLKEYNNIRDNFTFEDVKDEKAKQDLGFIF